MMTNIEKARKNMVTQQIRSRAVLDHNVLSHISAVPRELFVPETYGTTALGDFHLPLEHGQVMLKPSEEGLMLQALEIQPEDRILEVGAGTGYTAALLGQMGEDVTSVDIFPEFVSGAEKMLQNLQINNVSVLLADAADETNAIWKQQYDVVSISAALLQLPKYMLNAMAVGGRMFAVLGQAPVMQGVKIERMSDTNWRTATVFETVIPPMIHGKTAELFQF